LKERLPRKLTAILYADVAGYSRLTGEDEEGTHKWLSTYLDAISEAVRGHSGRVVHYAGDAVLADFPTVTDALECATAVQYELADRNRDLPEERRVCFRIGVNLGEVIVDRNDIYGDGVNVAARLEALADPGGICVSESVRTAVGNKLPVEYEFLGEQHVKNIARPIAAYKIRDQKHSAVSGSGPVSVSSKPSIVVLPLVNMSGDPEQEFFVDGLTEDIITELSRFRELFVISRNSAFVYKGKPVKVRNVARDLGVQYVLEGSVRKAGNQVRVTVQLIDAENDRHVWGERYQRQLEDIFALQDEVATKIVSTLPARIEAAAHVRVSRKPPENMAAYEYVLAGKIFHHNSTREDNEKALHMLEKALEIDPAYGHAHAWRACVLGQAWVYGWGDESDRIWMELLRELKIAIDLDDNDSDVHRILAAVNIVGGDHDRALYHQERGLSLNPNYDLIVVQQGELLTWLGRPQEGIEWIRKAMQLNPHFPQRFWNHLGRAHFVARQYQEAIDAFKRITTPDYIHHAFLAACYAYLGDDVRAADHAREVLTREPKFTVRSYLETTHYKNDGDLEHHRKGLLKSGLPKG
jgi:adenylate cyclase